MASAVILARIRQLAPEFATLTDAEIAAWADVTGPYLSTAVFAISRYTGQVIGGTSVTIYDEATALLTAHLLTRMPTVASGGTGGTSGLLVTQDTTGDLAQAYGLPANLPASLSDMDLMSTRYGIAFSRLRNTRAAFAAPTAV